eukprot:TRINITY_DN36885_c0_g1_i1.p1 TRINITY_DN36885_c0_g1~~TRINITY_DN36885_c0_g1_i1.p1  ORF type:complete len:267 (+),score=50.95 TRINITY_DN36885_c0_g1_i1:1871-2671(+)
MACLVLRSGNTLLKGATGDELDQERRRRRHLGRDRTDQDFLSPASFYPLRSSGKTNPRMRATIRNALISSPVGNAARNPLFLSISNQESLKSGSRDKKHRAIVSPERLDEWIGQSITEIVGNISEAPFLVHVYSDRENGLPTRLEREKGTEDNWPYIKTRWEEENGKNTPDGVILVKRLDGDDDGRGQVAEVEEKNSDANSSSSLCSRLWGIVIQGRGLDRPACYVLETTRVCSSLGFCTHFCLSRAKCFGKSPELQLRDSWLLTH